MKLYKLTGCDGQTCNNTQWGPGATHTALGPADGPLCSDSWIHAYEHPLIAVLMNPTHGDFTNPRLWEAEGEVGKRDGQLKCGCRSLTTVKEMELPQVTIEQKIRFAIGCTWRQGKRNVKWREWATKWLTEADRSREAARAAAAALAAGAAAARAAGAAAWGVEATEWEAAEWDAVVWAAARAAEAAEAAEEEADAMVDIVSIAEWAITTNMEVPE